MIVADAAVIAGLTISSEHSALAEAAYEADAEWAAPALWLSEYRDTLAKCMQHNNMSLESALLSLRSAEEIVGERQFQVASEKVLALVAASGCAAYDCEYVALAQDLKVPLLTTDKKLLRAFPRVAVSLEQFSRQRK
jgi:predicted nucleic acid-binding protein